MIFPYRERLDRDRTYVACKPFADHHFLDWPRNSRPLCSINFPPFTYVGTEPSSNYLCVLPFCSSILLYAFYDNTLSHLSSDRKLDEISRRITVDKKFLRILQMVLQSHKIEEITVSLGYTRKDKDGYKNKCTYLHVDRYK